MFCKNCGKEIENDAVRCPNCGELCNAEIKVEQKAKVDIKKNLTENIYKILLPISSIIVFFLPWINFAGTAMSFLKVNSTINEIKKMADSVLGVIGLNVDSVLELLGNSLGSGNEVVALLQKVQWILYIEIVMIIVNVLYVVLAALKKEKDWMMGSLILLHILFCVGVILVRFVIASEFLKLSVGPIIMIIVQVILGELAGQRDHDLRETMI